MTVSFFMTLDGERSKKGMRKKILEEEEEEKEEGEETFE